MRSKQEVNKRFRINLLTHLVAYALFGSLAVPLSAYADEELEEIQVSAKAGGESSKAQRSLTSVLKSADQIKKEQVTDIRDLTRYDPGIAVNEQGSGASAGYSIRGVDRDRVAITVDGIPQAQNYTPESNASGRFSGAKNEIEFENIKSVEISQGANSVLSGNGALGGAVMFTSKDPDDVIKPGQNYGLDIINRYGSKDERWSKSIAAAARVGGFAGLIQYTRRDGKEIKAHKDTPNQTMTRMFPTEYQYQDLRAGGWNVTRPAYFPQGENCLGKELPSDCFATLDLSPNEVYGPTRGTADPMDYRSDSWYGKFQYEFNPSHKIGVLFENTQQLREIEKRSENAFYHSWKEVNPNWNHSYPYRTLFPTYQFVDHNHSKKRVGIFYEYQAENRNALFDRLKVELDRDQTVIESRYTHSSCTLRGNQPERDCRIFAYQGNMLTDVNRDPDNPLYGAPLGIGVNNHSEFQLWRRTDTKLDEKYKRLRFNAQKQWDYWGIKHDIDLVAGIGRSKFDLSETYLHKGYLKNFDGSVDIYATGLLPDIITMPRVDTQTPSPNNYPIHGKSYYLGVSNSWQVGRYLDLIGGIRYDSHAFNSQLPHFKNDHYSNLSWTAGASLNLSENFSLHYKSSTGFRVPNSQEMYGTDVMRRLERFDNTLGAEREKIKQEEALNHEIGFDLHGNVGYLTLNIFRTDYKNFITTKSKRVDDRRVNYIGNQTEAFSEGFNIKGMIDFHTLWDKIPAGFSGMAAYSKVRPRKIGKLSGDKSNWLESSFAMDTLQPAKTVLGVDYDAPSGKWGVGVRFTRSDAKKASELVTVLPNIDIRGVRQNGIVRKTSKSWYIWDLTGYTEIGKNVTLRGGVYNLMNAKYITWESLRQVGKAGISTADQVEAYGHGYDRLTAPGRNFALSLEIKF
ncbi:hypothetical protein A1D23_04890 [Chelonobacter oris]|uniref:TonB-dependent hemoglobin/transferrin/lactoferrin family receptor n=1 Tax=Chelonobacter oris TaxID=505317 RepID=UPI00244AE3AC|nr:TonB-dependent hemoglobin/transferrin/lactoferrin family receptor [Chelonobacter oris]MDH2999436.1 hypothetical protein [Chelonobacter oris]